jgi:hypothetical protein
MGKRPGGGEQRTKVSGQMREVFEFGIRELKLQI